MKLFLVLCFLSVCTLQAQQIDYNLKKGYVAEGYDVVSYFKGTPVEGKKSLLQHTTGQNLNLARQKIYKSLNKIPNIIFRNTVAIVLMP